MQCRIYRYVYHQKLNRISQRLADCFSTSGRGFNANLERTCISKCNSAEFFLPRDAMRLYSYFYFTHTSCIHTLRLRSCFPPSLRKNTCCPSGLRGLTPQWLHQTTSPSWASTWYDQPVYQIWSLYLSPQRAHEMRYQMWKMWCFGVVRSRVTENSAIR